MSRRKRTSASHHVSNSAVIDLMSARCKSILPSQYILSTYGYHFNKFGSSPVWVKLNSYTHSDLPKCPKVSYLLLPSIVCRRRHTL